MPTHGPTRTGPSSRTASTPSSSAHRAGWPTSWNNSRRPRARTSCSSRRSPTTTRTGSVRTNCSRRNGGDGVTPSSRADAREHPTDRLHATLRRGPPGHVRRRSPRDRPGAGPRRSGRWPARRCRSVDGPRRSGLPGTGEGGLAGAGQAAHDDEYRIIPPAAVAKKRRMPGRCARRARAGRGPPAERSRNGGAAVPAVHRWHPPRAAAQ